MITRRRCIDFLRKKNPFLIKEEDAPDDVNAINTSFDLKSLTDDSFNEFRSVTEGMEAKERVERMREALDPQNFTLLVNRHVEGYTLKELVARGDLKKSAFAERLSILEAYTILSEVDRISSATVGDEILTMLKRITRRFRPDDSSAGKRRILASTLSHMGDVYQVQGRTIAGINHYLGAREIWGSLHDKDMMAVAEHGIALCTNISGRYVKAIKIMNSTKERYSGGNAYIRTRYGDWERDFGAIYLNLNELELAKSHIDKSLNILKDTGQQDSYYATLYKRGQMEIKLGHFDKAYDNLQESLQHCHPGLVLQRIQAMIALTSLLLLTADEDQALRLAKEADAKAEEFGFAHQRAKLRRLLVSHGASLN
jgi:tetratricopeptide (TPR) repeat protein